MSDALQCAHAMPRRTLPPPWGGTGFSWMIVGKGGAETVELGSLSDPAGKNQSHTTSV